MSGQFRVAFRTGLSQRITMLLVCIAVNLGFLLAWQMGARHPAVQIVGVVFSGISLTGVIVVQIISDVKIIRGVFRAPGAYTVMMAPVPGYKILFGRAAAIIVMDVIGFSVAILGQLLHSFLLGGLGEMWHWAPGGLVGWSVVVFLLFYSLLILALFFAESLRAGIFYRRRLRGFLGLLAAVVALAVLSLLDFLLLPFGMVYRFGFFFNITLRMSLNPGMLLFIVLTLVKSAVLFLATSYGIERKINV